MFIEGRLMALVLLTAYFVAFIIYRDKAQKGTEIKIRDFPAVLALPEAVGRCAEMGKPLFWHTGSGGGTLRNPQYGPMTIASINMLGHVAKTAVESGVQVRVFTPIADALPLIEETLRDAYIRAGNIEAFDPTAITFMSGHGLLTNYLGSIQREQPGSCIIMGGVYYASLVLGESGNTIGALQIGGTANMYQVPFLVATCDYSLIMEELYAASAVISKDPNILGSIAGEDIIKIGILAITGLGTLLGLLNITFLVDILGV